MRNVCYVVCLCLSLANWCIAQTPILLSTFSSPEFNTPTTTFGFSIYPTGQPNLGIGWIQNDNVAVGSVGFAGGNSALDSSLINIPNWNSIVNLLTNQDSNYSVALVRNGQNILEIPKSQLTTGIVQYTTAPRYAAIPNVVFSSNDFNGYQMKRIFMSSGSGAQPYADGIVIGFYGSLPVVGIGVPEPSAIMLLLIAGLIVFGFIRL